jgi:hypothetical protein
MHKGVAALAAATVMLTAVCVLPADAAKKQRQYGSPSTSTSLDGRNLGYARTCWRETFVYDHRGVPMGPYCH